MIESGEVFIRLVNQTFGDSKVPLGLEVLEADLLDDDYTGVEANGNRVRMGVEINEWGRPVAYHFLRTHPGDYQFIGTAAVVKRRQRIPAKDVIHLYSIERPGQTRGVTGFASAIMRLRNLSGYEEAEIVAARASSAMMAFVRTPDQEPGGSIPPSAQSYSYEPCSKACPSTPTFHSNPLSPAATARAH
jgi:lambda family phage portal protein